MKNINILLWLIVVPSMTLRAYKNTDVKIKNIFYSSKLFQQRNEQFNSSKCTLKYETSAKGRQPHDLSFRQMSN